MKTNNWILIALLVLLAISVIFNREQFKQVNKSRQAIKQAQRDSVIHAQQVIWLAGKIKEKHDSLEVVELRYSEQIERVKTITITQIDSIFIERYNVTLTDIDIKGARLLTADLLRLDEMSEKVRLLNRVVQMQKKQEQHYLGIIKSDSVQIVNLRIQAKEGRKYKRQNTLLKIGGGTVILLGLIIR